MKLLLALRFLGFAVAVLTVVLPWIAPGVSAVASKTVRKIALALGLGAQLGLTGSAIAYGRVPWTKIVFPILGVVAFLETGFSSAFPGYALVGVAACEAVVIGFVVVRALGVARERGAEYPEDVLRREFARLVDARVARYLALETMLVTSAGRYLMGGFSRPAPEGFSYVIASDVPLLLALPVFLIVPEMVAIDLVVPHQLWGLRLASFCVHAYAIVWALGAYATFRERPHRLCNDRVRFSCGVLSSLEIALAEIRSAVVGPSAFDARAWKRANADDGHALTVSGAPVVFVELASPIRVEGWLRTRTIRRLAVSADRPSEFARALRDERDRGRAIHAT